MTIWSPSHVNKWLECPLKWSLGRQGVPGVREKWSPGLIVGTALHAGLAHHFNNGPDAEGAAWDVLSAGWPQDGDTGDFSPDAVRPKMAGALRRAFQRRLPHWAGSSATTRN